jgi:hypothetical protein
MNEKKSTTAVTQKEKTETATERPEKEPVQKSEDKELVPQQGAPKLEVPKSLNMAYLYRELQALKQMIIEHEQQIADLQKSTSQRRRPTTNSKIQVKDKQTGKVYPSKNNAYQSLLKSGELKDLVEKGVFGPVPEKNTFGWYTLVREWPDRFGEVTAAQNNA